MEGSHNICIRGDMGAACICPECAAHRFIEIHLALGFEAADVVESLSHGLTVVLSSLPKDIMEEVLVDVLSNIEEAVMFRVEGPVVGETVH
tara:strand:- start:267 stop:539 length:273 start_codon:yes stop_codon:yes gene_type:complete